MSRVAPRTTGLGEIKYLHIYSSIKQNLSPAWLLGPQAYGKFIT